MPPKRPCDVYSIMQSMQSCAVMPENIEINGLCRRLRGYMYNISVCLYRTATPALPLVPNTRPSMPRTRFTRPPSSRLRNSSALIS